MKTPSGLINQKIEIYSDTDIDNNSGGVNPRSMLYWATAAATRPIKVQRANLQGVITFEAGMEFKIRDRIDKNVANDMLLKYRDSFYTIISAIPDYIHNEMMVIKAVTSKPPVRIIETESVAYWGFKSTNTVLNKAVILGSNPVVFELGKDITFPIYVPNLNYIWIAYPDSQNNRTAFLDLANANNNGPVGTDQDWFGVVQYVEEFKFQITNYKSKYNPIGPFTGIKFTGPGS